MKLRELHFAELVVVPGWVRQAGGPSVGREQSFSAAEGWTLERIEDRTYRVHREDMPEPVTIEGFAASYVVAAPEEDYGSPEVAPPDPASASPKERDMAAHVDAGAPPIKRRRRKP